jgi:imidazolonepropionase-like amidohydrolase
MIYTMAGPAIENGIVLVREGKISAIGGASDIEIPTGFRVLEAEVVTPGLVDAHSTVGLSGIFNYRHDQDQLERSSPIQPELRAIDAYNSQEELVGWIRSFGITTVHTGHGPGELISGQTIVVKTTGTTVEAATLVDSCAVAATLSTAARKNEKKSPGTSAKMMAMLRTQFYRADEYRTEQTASRDAIEETGKEQQGDQQTGPSRDLRLETLVRVLDKELPLLITAHRAQDIMNALRLAKEFDIRIWLDGAAEAHLLVSEIKAAGVPVIIHPLMARPVSDLKNMSFETPAKLLQAGIPVVFQSGYENYVPKTRVVLFEAAMAAANGVTFEQALAGITRDAANLLGVGDRVGTLEIGKDGDLALFDGDPFEYATHCQGVVIEGKIVSDTVR